MRIAFNLIVLYAAWFGAVLSAAANRPVLAAVASLVAIAVNLAISAERWADTKLVLLSAVVGLILDGLLINAGIATYASPNAIAGLPPVWLTAMWMAFATSLNVSLGWLQRRLVLASLLGFVGGPASYLAGARLGAMQFSTPLWQSLAVVGILWAVAFPGLLFAARFARGRRGSG